MLSTEAKANPSRQPEKMLAVSCPALALADGWMLSTVIFADIGSSWKVFEDDVTINATVAIYLKDESAPSSIVEVA